jgi:hypothetical protein
MSRYTKQLARLSLLVHRDKIKICEEKIFLFILEITLYYLFEWFIWMKGKEVCKREPNAQPTLTLKYIYASI